MRCATRRTCRSTGKPGEKTKRHVPGPRCRSCGPTPLRAVRSCHVFGNLAAVRSRPRLCAIASKLRLLARKKTRRLDHRFQVVRRGSRECGAFGYRANNAGRHLIHAFVGALRGEDGRDSQFVRIRENAAQSRRSDAEPRGDRGSARNDAGRPLFVAMGRHRTPASFSATVPLARSLDRPRSWAVCTARICSCSAGDQSPEPRQTAAPAAPQSEL
jgi:hypothetical protein